MKKILRILPVVIFLALIFPIVAAYFQQESLVFGYKPLPVDHEFPWSIPYKEVFYHPKEGVKIHGARFHVEEPKGVVLLLHGRYINLDRMNWEKDALSFTNNGYDVLIIDYRKFGKSEGELSEQAILDDCVYIYDELRKEYEGKEVIVYGQSLGTGFATYVAAERNPDKLILVAPYYNLLEQAYLEKPYFPKFVFPAILKYPIRTDQWITSVNCPIYFFHATDDEICPYESSIRLMERVKSPDQAHLVTLHDWGHNWLSGHPHFGPEITQILTRS